jgi:hypothetical protein
VLSVHNGVTSIVVKFAAADHDGGRLRMTAFGLERADANRRPL